MDFGDGITADLIEQGLRLIVATVAGMAIGLNRDVTGKPMGMRTLGLVSLGAALIAVTVVHVGDLASHPDALSRLVQGTVEGVMTGVGFLGAGVILHDRKRLDVHGLTTAATVWLAAAIGVACGLAAWHLVVLGTVLTLVILIVMVPLERWLVQLFAGTAEPRDESKPEAGGAS